MGINVEFEAGTQTRSRNTNPNPENLAFGPARPGLAPVAGLAFVMPKCFGELIFGVNDVQF